MAKDKEDEKIESPKLSPLKQVMIDALRKNKGLVSYAAKDAGINRRTHNRWLDSDPEYKEAVEDIQYECKDFGQRQLFKAMRGFKIEHVNPITGERYWARVKPDTSAIIFYNKTINKDLGYVERQEITGKDGEKLVNIIIPDGI